MLLVDDRRRFCTERAALYQRLVNEIATNGRVRLVAVLPQEVAESRRCLLNLKVPRVGGTRTLILVSAKGEVTEGWAGKLSAEK